MRFHQPVNVLIVESEKAYAQLLEVVLLDIGCKKPIIAQNSTEALLQFQQHPPDVCIISLEFNDISEPALNLAEQFRALDDMIPIILITSNYSQENYDRCRFVKPNGFLNKELSTLKFFQAIDVVLQKASVSKHTPAIPIPEWGNRFFFKSGDAYQFLPIDEIYYFFSEEKLTYAKMASGDYPMNVQLKTLEQELFYSFIRIHKSYLINKKHLESIHPGENTVMVAGYTLPIGHTFRKIFFDRVVLLR
jgi:DNA-binding LytR/AlgR family response regulator